MERIKRRSPPWGQLPLEESQLDPSPLLFFLVTGNLWLSAVTLGDDGVGVCRCPCLEEGGLWNLGCKEKLSRRIRAGGVAWEGAPDRCFSLHGEQKTEGNSPSAQKPSLTVAAMSKCQLHVYFSLLTSICLGGLSLHII